MSIINNYVSKIYKNESHNPLCILTYIDYDKQLTPKMIFNYATVMIENNPILKKNMEKHDNTFVLKDIENFNIKDYITIKYVEQSKFNNYIKLVLKQPLINDMFLILCCIDKCNKKSRIYFKINHAYTDGYKLIDILTKPLLKKETIPDFKRNTGALIKTIYHYIIGTYVLLVINFKIFIKLLYSNAPTNKYTEAETDYIICKPFCLNKIKEIAKKNGCTINDFLYSILIKTDKLYTKKTRNIQTCSPINVSKISDTNNICPILNYINNSLDNHCLLQKVHKTFDHFKYSLFIPFISFFINQISSYVSLEFLSMLYNFFINSSDYIYTNVIGPSIKDINESSDMNISNVHFLITSKMDEIIYNIISCNDKINLICSFRKGRIKDKKRFEKCIYKAYNHFINIDDTGFV